MKCPYCEVTEWDTAKNDLGFGHFKADGMKPIRMLVKRCKGCGHVAVFAPKEGQ